jgi:hypothetical protein
MLLPCKAMLLERARSRKSRGPPLFEPSFKIQRDDTHSNSGFSVIQRLQSPAVSWSRANDDGRKCVPKKDRDDFPPVLKSDHTIAACGVVDSLA